MAIRLYQSLSGYVASPPSTNPTQDGTPRFYALAGQKQGRRASDGTRTLPTEYMPIVAYGDAAEKAAALVRKGHDFVAAGRVRAVAYEKDGKTVDSEEFEFWQIARLHRGSRRSSPRELAAGADAPAATDALRSETPAESTRPRPHAATSPAIAL